MNAWDRFLALVEAEAGPELRARVELRARQELGGARITIPSRLRPPDADIHRALATVGYNVRRAAALLGVSPSSLYRRLGLREPPRHPPLIR